MHLSHARHKPLTERWRVALTLWWALLCAPVGARKSSDSAVLKGVPSTVAAALKHGESPPSDFGFARLGCID
ncbi:MAG: hypothetical protein HEQ39_08975 [Rhizobacter sp.]